MTARTNLTSVEVDYTYRSSSVLTGDDAGARLAFATSGGTAVAGQVSNPFFFAGFVEHPDVVAQALLVVARVARTRFYLPPNSLAAVLRTADPVVTSSPDGLRFESFSPCCGVYARLDVDAAALDATFSAAGVTNVDVNQPLRQALVGVGSSEPLHLAVGAVGGGLLRRGDDGRGSRRRRAHRDAPTPGPTRPGNRCTADRAAR